MRSARHQADPNGQSIGGLGAGKGGAGRSRRQSAGRSSRLKRLASVLACGTLAAGVMGSGGCNSLNPLDIKSFIDPGELGRYKQDPLQLKILDHVDPRIEEPNTDFVTAVEPTQEDLTSKVSDYAISKNDLLTIEISDLTGPGTQTVKTTRVTESGNISLPYLTSPIHAEGLTESELERTIVDRYRTENIIQKAQVSVIVTEARGRAFSILGQVGHPAQYAIVDPDFRVLDALVLAGDTTSPLLEDLYIIRKTSSGGGSGGSTPPSGSGPTAPRPTTGPDDLAPRGSLHLGGPALAMSGLGQPGRGVHALHLDAGAGDLSPAAVNSPAAPLAPEAPVLAQATRGASPAAPIDLSAPAQPVAPVDPLAPGAVPAAPATSTTDVAPGTAATPATPAPAAPAAPAYSEPPAGASGATTAAPPRSGFEGFHELVPPSDVKIIHVNLQALKSGQLQWNIVVKPHDQIIVPALQTGVYYMGGHVQSSGAYALTGQRVTLKQAIISAHMLDQLAIPQRTDIIRRLDKNREVFVRVDLDRIFAGHEPDIYIKPNDQVMVGTNIIAPFLSAVRGAFRITYGFGFLYDRNFAFNSANGTVQ